MNPRRRVLGIIAVATGLLITGQASAATIVPNTTLDEQNPTRLCSLRDAVASANTNADTGGCTHSGTYGADTINLGSGDYDLTLGALTISDPVTIAGVSASQTKIDGNGPSTGDRVMYLPSTRLSLQDLTVHRGAATNAAGGGILTLSGTTLNLTRTTVTRNTAAQGGGLWVHAILNLTDSTVSDNTATSSEGGGIYVQNPDGEAHLTNSTVSGNSATQGGGLVVFGSARLTDSTVSDNLATSGSGGGIFGPPTLVRSTVRNNWARLDGGGLAGTGTLTMSKVVGNQAAGSGGGLSGVNYSLTRSLVALNLSQSDGGGIATSAGDLTITASTVAANQTTNPDHQGGGIYFAGANFNLRNSTVSANRTTGWGGGLSSAAGTTILKNATINRNVADADFTGLGNGGGIDQAPGGAINLNNTIVAGNVDPNNFAPDCNGNGSVNSTGFNLFGRTKGCGVSLLATDQNLAGANPKVAPLEQNGGPTPTSALLSGSPAIDKGSPAVPGTGGTACFSKDQRGIKRPQGPRCDIGAFEKRPSD
jgi:parallel beta-helix repeat protein